MMYGAYEIIMTLFDLFNNPISIFGACAAVVMGLFICKYTNYKFIISIICSSILIVMFGLWACVLNNTPDLLWLPLLFMPFLIVFIITSAAYCAVKRMLKRRG